jgi:hypothetical protein
MSVLAKHEGSGGFDHAAACARNGRVYAAHTVNSAVDVFVERNTQRMFAMFGK